MAGEEFATALLKFVADDSQVQSVADRVEKRAVSTAKKVDDAFRESFRRAQGESGAVAPGGAAGTGAGARTEKQHVADLESMIQKLRDTRSAATKAGEDASAGFSDGFKRGMSGVDKPLAELGSKIGGVARLLTSPAALIVTSVLAIGAAVVDSTKKALEFDASFRDLAVFVDPSVISVEKLRARVVALDPALGSATERVHALREAFLDTGNLEDAFRIEGVSAKLNKVTGLARESGARIIGSLADAFRDQGTTYERIGDVLLEVQKRGGGNIEELGNGFLVLSDAAATLNLNIDDLGAALITLGERAGANPQKNIQALALLLRTLSLNTDEFKRRGFDVKEIVKVEGFTGLMRVMKEATQGSEEQLKELGISGRNVTTILKILSDEGVKTFVARLDELKNTAGGSVDKALETRGKFISDTLDKGSKILNAAQLSFGERVLGVARKRVEGTASEQLVGIKKLINDIEKEMAPMLKRQERLGKDAGPTFAASSGLAALQERKGALLVVADALTKVIDEQDKTTDSTDKVTDSTKKATVASTAWQRTQESLNDTLRQLDTDRIVRAADDVVKASERTLALTEANGAAEVAMMEARRQVDSVRAQSEGREARGLEALLSVRKRVLEDGTAATLSAIAIQSAATQKSLEAERDKIKSTLEARRARPFAATDPQTQTEITALTSQLEAAENKLDDARENSIQRRRLAEIKANQDRVQDDTRASQERQAAVERELQRQERIEEKTFQLRKSLGEATAVDEIARLAKLTNSHKESVEKRLDAEKDLADKTKALREAAASAGESLLQKAASRLAAKGVTEGSLKDLQDEIDRMQKEASETIGDLGAGGKVSLSKLPEAFSTAKEGTARALAGRTVGDEITQALEGASRGLSGTLADGTKVVLAFNDALQAATATLTGTKKAAQGGALGGAAAGGGGGAYERAIAAGEIPRGRKGDESYSETGVFLGPQGAILAAQDAEMAAREARYKNTQGGLWDEAKNSSRSLSPAGVGGTDVYGRETGNIMNAYNKAFPDSATARYDATHSEQFRQLAMSPAGEPGAIQDAGGASVASYGNIGGAWTRGFAETQAAADRFLTTFSDRIRSGSSEIAESLFETFMEKVVRRLDDESRRQ